MRDLRENDGNRTEQTRKPEPDPGQKQDQGQGSGKKRWLSGAGTGIAAGLLMGLMGSVIFFTRGLYAFQQGADGCRHRLHGADGRIPSGYGHRGVVDGKGN